MEEIKTFLAFELSLIIAAILMIVVILVFEFLRELCKTFFKRDKKDKKGKSDE